VSKESLKTHEYLMRRWLTEKQKKKTKLDNIVIFTNADVGFKGLQMLSRYSKPNTRVTVFVVFRSVIAANIN